MHVLPCTFVRSKEAFFVNVRPRRKSRRIEAESKRSNWWRDPDEGRQRDWVEGGRAVCSGGRPGLIRKVDIGVWGEKGAHDSPGVH